MLRGRLAIAAAAVLAGCVADTDENNVADSVSAPRNVELGTLTCRLAATENLFIYAKESFACLFEGEDRRSSYAGRITKVGANLQLKNNQRLTWLVLAPSRYDVPGALEGSYIGASGEAAIGVGAGAKLLVGGSDDAITLQPLSVSTSTDAVGLSLTIDSLKLDYAGPA